MSSDRLTVKEIQEWSKREGNSAILAMTAYDYPTARHLDQGGVDILHVGDTLGMVILGYSDTTKVTMEDMLRHTSAVQRGRERALITADLPYHSYETEEDAVKNSQALIEAGADAVKMEGGREIIAQVKAVMKEGISVQGHLGMLPQHILEEGGVYRKKGKTKVEADRIKDDALLLESEGVFSIVLEAVVSEVADDITETLSIPTLGIASSENTTGQIKVFHDVMGLTPWYDFPHVKMEAKLGEMIQEVVRKLKEEG